MKDLKEWGRAAAVVPSQPSNPPGGSCMRGSDIVIPLCMHEDCGNGATVLRLSGNWCDEHEPDPAKKDV